VGVPGGLLVGFGSGPVTDDER